MPNFQYILELYRQKIYHRRGMCICVISLPAQNRSPVVFDPRPLSTRTRSASFELGYKQIHMCLESIEDGRALTGPTGTSKKPIVIFKSNVSKAVSKVACSRTAILSNNDRIIDCAMKQGGLCEIGPINHGRNQ